jgi:hypothetical protein
MQYSPLWFSCAHAHLLPRRYHASLFRTPLFQSLLRRTRRVYIDTEFSRMVFPLLRTEFLEALAPARRYSPG